MKYRDLNASPSKKLAEIVKGLQSTGVQGATGAHGVKHMGLTGDSLWYRPDGTEYSVRDIDGDLQDAQTRIDDAMGALEDTQTRLEDAEQAVDSVRAELDGIDWDALGAEVYTEGPPPSNPTIGKALWVSPSGRVFRAVECEEQA